MKKHLFILLIPLSFGLSQNKVNINNLVQYGDKWCKENDDRPFSGIVFDMDKETGNKILEYSMSKGEKNGRYKEWNQEGVLIKDGFYKTELMNGKWKFYYNNGNKLGIPSPEVRIIGASTVGWAMAIPIKIIPSPKMSW